jgi:glyoxylase-like metal-dependent hydrolase (beta-lactamase superfamily II)
MTSEGEEAIWACLKPLPIIEEERDRNVHTLENIVNIIKLPWMLLTRSPKFGPMHLEPIIVDEQLNDNDTIIGTNLQVIHTPGHTPGHISLFHREYGIVFGADFLFNSVFGTEGLFIPPSVVSIDPLTALISVQRVSRIKFDKLLLAHQSRPKLEGGQKAVEKVVTDNLKK